MATAAEIAQTFSEPEVEPQDVARSLATVGAGVLERIRSGTPIVQTISCGWGLLDETMGGFPRGEFTGIIGSPGAGKSTFADQIVVGSLRRNPEARAIVFNLETHEDVRFARLVASSAVRVGEYGQLTNLVPVGALLRGTLQEHAQARAEEAAEHLIHEIGDRLAFCYQFSEADEIAQVIEAERPDIVEIDHMGLVLAGQAEGEVARLDSALARISAALRTTNAAGILINEVSKAALKDGSVSLSASRGSARFASLAAAFVGLARKRPTPPEREPEIVAVLEKSRFGNTDMMQRAKFHGGLAYFDWQPVEPIGKEDADATDTDEAPDAGR